MLLSWKLWRWLDAVPTTHPVHSLLNVKPETTPVPTVVMLMGIGGLCLCAIFPYIFLPAGIVWYGTRFALRISGTIAKQREVGNHDLLAITPMGALGIGLAISHLYTMGTRAFLTTALIVAGGGTAVMLLIALGALVMSVVAGPMSIAAGILFVVTWGIGSFIVVQTFIQELSLGVIIGMLGGSLGERNTARLAAASGCIGIQVASYIFLVLSLSFITRFITPLDLHANVDAAIRILFGAVVFFAVREIIIYALWRQLLLRLNDDILARKVKAQ